jgi:transposase InsO family protein
MVGMARCSVLCPAQDRNDLAEEAISRLPVRAQSVEQSRSAPYFARTQKAHSAQWTAQQIVEAFPFDTAPGYLIRDGDGIYGERVTRRMKSLGINEFMTAPASPWQNAYVERVIGTLRRERFDHVIVLDERHHKRLLSSYLDDCQPWRTHPSLDRDAPDGRPVRAAEPSNVLEFPPVHGLHRVYLPEAA